MQILPRLNKLIFPVSFIDILISLIIFGFLVVIILAVINPLERIRKKEDVLTYEAAKNLSQILSAYILTENKPPWEATSDNDSPTPENNKPQLSWLEELNRTNKLPEGFQYLTYVKEDLHINYLPRKVCFYPDSVEYRQLGKYDEGGVNECLPQGFTPCYICFDY